jgi:HPt (histidine-containing phosphotransfer) domain-containing protein
VVLGLLDKFIAKVESQIAEIAVLMPVLKKQEGDISGFPSSEADSSWSKLKELAHSIKGASWNLSAKRSGDAARDLEDAATRKDLKTAEIAQATYTYAFAEFKACARYYIGLYAQSGDKDTHVHP